MECCIAVPRSGSLVITGGLGSGRRVQRVTSQGQASPLPDLVQPRFQHACGYYHDSGNIVSRYNHLLYR